MPQDAEQIGPVSLPPAVGDAILHAEPLRHGQANAATGGIWRVRGPVGTAILKVARRPVATDPPRAFPTSDVPTHWNYWRRESLAYETGLAATAYADAGITAPALLGAGTRPDGGIEFWLADVGGTWFGPAMAVRAARDDLGRSSYRQDTSAAAAIRLLTPLVTLIADWADQITALR